MSKHYKPLPDCLTIKESPIHGLGLFAVEDIPKHTNLGISHTTDRSFNLLPWDWRRTPLGGFYNHSENPNAFKDWFRQDGLDCMKLVTLRDIKAGEEITVKYTMYDPTKDQV